MPEDARPGHQYLSAEHAKSTETDLEWDQDNQQWWDWYMSLAENETDEGKEPLIELPAPISHPAPEWTALLDELSQPFSLSPAQIESFQDLGYIKLKNVLSPGALSLLRFQLAAMFEQQSEQLGHRFGSLEMMWEQNQIVRAFVFSTRLARLAAELLGVAAVRLYHDNGMSKQPGCGRTPWHYDDHHFPIATQNVCTVWIPLQEIPAAMGPLGFAKGMDVVKLVQDIPFSKFDTSYDRLVSARLRDHHIEVDASPFELGEQLIEVLQTKVDPAALQCWSIDYEGRLDLEDRETAERYLQRCLFDDTISLDDMLADQRMGDHLRSCINNTNGMWRFPQKVWLIAFGELAKCIGEYRRR